MFAILMTIPDDYMDPTVHGPFATKNEACVRAAELGEAHLRSVEGHTLDANEDGTEIWVHEEADEPQGGVVWAVYEMQR